MPVTTERPSSRHMYVNHLSPDHVGVNLKTRSRLQVETTSKMEIGLKLTLLIALPAYWILSDQK